MLDNQSQQPAFPGNEFRGVLLGVRTARVCWMAAIGRWFRCKAPPVRKGGHVPAFPMPRTSSPIDGNQARD